MLAAEKGVKEKDIDTAIAYINLTGKINTGKFDYKLDTQKIKDSQIETVKKHVLQLFEYMDDPNKFIERMIDKHYYFDGLGEEIFEKVYSEYKNSKVV